MTEFVSCHHYVDGNGPSKSTATSLHGAVGSGVICRGSGGGDFTVELDTRDSSSLSPPQGSLFLGTTLCL